MMSNSESRKREAELAPTPDRMRLTSNDELRRLLAEAAPAPWAVTGDGHALICTDELAAGAVETTDLAFIAALRNEATRLLHDSDEAERLRGPDRDTTGLTYADREAWDDLCGRWRTAQAERDAARAAHYRLLADMRRLCADADEWRGSVGNGDLTTAQVLALVARHTSEGSE